MSLPVPELISIPAGTLQQGQPPFPEDADLPHPWHSGSTIHIQAFKIGKYPVTNAQYQAYLDATGYEHPSHMDTEGFSDPQQPVGLSWLDADAYVQWLGEVTGQPFRLPHDAEWEYAARGGRPDGRFPWGDELTEAQACYGGKSTPPKVGSFPANGFGVYDMIGTIWEWCADPFNDVAQRSTSVNAPTGRDTADNRVLRGGSYATTNELHLWIAYRHEDPIDLRHPVLGMRVACDI